MYIVTDTDCNYGTLFNAPVTLQYTHTHEKATTLVNIRSIHYKLHIAFYVQVQSMIGLSDSENDTITIVEIVIFTTMNTITIVGLCGFVEYINS